MIVVIFPPMGEKEIFGEAVHLSILKDDELLVGGGVDEERIAFPSENVLKTHCHGDGMLGDVEVEVVGEKRVELYTDEASLCHEGTVLLCDTEEMLVRISMGEDDSLTAECSDLRTTDIEGVAVLG